MATKKTKGKPKPKVERDSTDSRYPAGDLPKVPQDVLRDIAKKKKPTAVEYEMTMNEHDRAIRKIDAVQDWPDHKERTHSATSTLQHAKLPSFKLADNRIALSRNQPKLQEARVKKQSEGGSKVRKAYRTIAVEISNMCVRKIPIKELADYVIDEAKQAGLPKRTWKTVERYLSGLDR